MIEQIYFVKNGDFSEVNKVLRKLDANKESYKNEVKYIVPVNECVSTSGNKNGYSDYNMTGDIFAYVVVQIW